MYILLEDTVGVTDNTNQADPGDLYKYFLYSGLRGYITTKLAGRMTVVTVLLLLSAFAAVSVSEGDSVVTFRASVMAIITLSCTAVYLVIGMFFLGGGIRRMTHVSKVYKVILGISDDDLKCMDWPEISQRILSSGMFPFKRDDHLSLSSRVNTFDNYFLALVSEGGPLADFPVITKCIEWYIRKTVFGYTFHNSKVTADVYNAGLYPLELDHLTRKFKGYLLVMLCIGVISIPFVFVYLIIHGIIRYSKDIRDRPKIMTAGAFTTSSKWKYREFNEYKNQFDRRINLASRPARKFTGLFRSHILITIRNTFAFIASAALFFVVSMGAVYDNVLTDDLFFGKSGLFYIAVLSAVIGVFRVPAFKPVPRGEYTEHLQEFAKHTHADISEFTGKEHLSPACDYVHTVYRYRITVYCIEVLSILVIPYLGWVLYKKAQDILYFLAKTGDTFTQSDSQKLEMSFINFNNTFGSFILNE